MNIVDTKNLKHYPDTREDLLDLIAEGVNLAEISTTKITDMQYLFKYSRESQEFYRGIENWDVSNVENMEGMFYCATIDIDVFFTPNKLDQVIQLDLTKWDVSKVKNTRRMFMFSTVNADISNWDVSNVEDMERMFYYCEYFECDLSKWDVSKVKNFNRMFFKSFHADNTEMTDDWNVSPDAFRTSMFYSNEFVPFVKDKVKWDREITHEVNENTRLYKFPECDDASYDFFIRDFAGVGMPYYALQVIDIDFNVKHPKAKKIKSFIDSIDYEIRKNANIYGTPFFPEYAHMFPYPDFGIDGFSDAEINYRTRGLYADANHKLLDYVRSFALSRNWMYRTTSVTVKIIQNDICVGTMKLIDDGTFEVTATPEVQEKFYEALTLHLKQKKWFTAYEYTGGEIELLKKF